MSQLRELLREVKDAFYQIGTGEAARLIANNLHVSFPKAEDTVRNLQLSGFIWRRGQEPKWLKKNYQPLPSRPNSSIPEEPEDQAIQELFDIVLKMSNKSSFVQNSHMGVEKGPENDTSDPFRIED